MLTALLLVVAALHLLQLASESLNLILVLIDLSLVHVKFGSHSFHLVSLLLKILLVNRKLFGNLRTRLSRKQVLKLDIEFLLLLNNNIFFDDFFSLLNKPFLESLDLLQHLPSVRIRTFKFTPSVVVEWVL